MAPLNDPRAGWTGDLEELARAGWAFALMIEAYRMGGLAAGSPLTSLPRQHVTEDALLGLASGPCVTELTSLYALGLRTRRSRKSMARPDVSLTASHRDRARHPYEARRCFRSRAWAASGPPSL